jgi:hypothetical protein
VTQGGTTAFYRGWRGGRQPIRRRWCSALKWLFREGEAMGKRWLHEEKGQVAARLHFLHGVGGRMAAGGVRRR